MPARKCKNCDEKKAKECSMRDACFRIGKGRRLLDVYVLKEGKIIAKKE